VLDEFGEVLNVPGAPDALMRSVFQASPDVSFLFMGSKRSLMDGLFSDRRRPFYNFGRRMELGRLPYEPLGEFVEGSFEVAGRHITPETVDVLLDLCQGHPHRAQQLSFHAFRLAKASGDVVDEETALAAKGGALNEAEREFRAILDDESVAPGRFRCPLQGTEDEPYSRPYMRRHGIKGSGALKRRSTDSSRPGTWRGRGQTRDPSRPIPCWNFGSASGSTVPEGQTIVDKETIVICPSSDHSAA
jgi:hypothetical protein